MVISGKPSACQRAAWAQASSSTSRRWYDETALLGARDEAGQRHELGAAAVPAQQGFDADDPARGEVDLRLVVQLELVLVERAVQRRLGLQAFERVDVHLLGVEAGGVAAGALGLIERRVGLLQQVSKSLPSAGQTAMPIDSVLQFAPFDLEGGPALPGSCWRPALPEGARRESR